MASGSQNNTTYQAQKWTNLRTFTIGDTAKDVDGTAAVSWSKDEILGASTDAYFLRGDKVWSNTLNGVLLLPKGLKTGARVSDSGSGIVIDNDGGIEIFHTSTPFIDFHYQASTADYSVRLMCDSATNIHDSGSFTAGKYITAKGDITADGGYLYSTLNGNTVQIGSQNGSYAHFTNTKDIPFWFNKVIESDGGFTIYNTGDNHWRNGYIKINNSGGGDCYVELRRAANADWRILNSGGHLYFQSNWTSAKGSYYNVLQLEYNSGNINVLRGNISISHATSADMAHSSANPKITFSESGGQPVHLIYTDYDSYRSPAGLKVVGGASASPAWFEVEGDVHIGSNLRLYRNSSVSYGRIHFYSNYKTWSIYMSNAAASACPSGGTPSTLGDVTNWALRSYIENSSGYGWLWESAAESNTGTPTARMALNANNGNLTLTGNLVFTNSGTAFRGINYGTMGDNDQWRIGGAATAANAGYMELATADDGNEPIYVRQYTGVFTTLKRTLTLLDASGNTNFPGYIYRTGVSRSWINGRDTAIIRTTSYSGYDAILSMKTTSGAWELGVYTDNKLYFTYTPDSKYNSGTNSGYAQVRIDPDGTFVGPLSGNASTATKLQTARAINGTNFDGSAAITTANWGTARNFTIKDYNSNNAGTAVSVNGSGAVTLLMPSTIYCSDVRSGNTRIVSDWLGFYQKANADGSRYGYIQVNANRMYFRKENGVSTYGFDFNSHLYTTGHYYASNAGPHLYLAVSDLTNVKDAKNGLSANREQGMACYSKDYGSWMGDFAQGYTQSNGQIWSRIYLRNYKTDGTNVNNYIYLYANKDGTTSYAVANAAAFRSAISAPSTTGSGASGSWDISVTGSAGSVAWSNVSSKPATATRWPSWSEVTSKPAVQNNLTSTSTTDMLSAAQGKALNDNKTAKGTGLTYTTLLNQTYAGTSYKSITVSNISSYNALHFACYFKSFWRGSMLIPINDFKSNQVTIFFMINGSTPEYANFKYISDTSIQISTDYGNSLVFRIWGAKTS